MRRLSLSIVLFVVLAVLPQLSFAQTVESDYASRSVNYGGVDYTNYHQGVVVSSGGAIQGQLLLNENGSGLPLYDGVKLKIIGGDDFKALDVEFDEEGNFSFEGEPGSYTAILDYNGQISSLDFQVTATEPNMASLAPDTGVSNTLRLVVDDQGYLRFASTQGKPSSFLPPPSTLPPPPPTTVPPPPGGAPGAPAASGLGGLAGALGIAGLVGGMVALGTNNSGGSTPVSPGGRLGGR